MRFEIISNISNHYIRYPILFLAHEPIHGPHTLIIMNQSKISYECVKTTPYIL
jgi:hypothetical protein